METLSVNTSLGNLNIFGKGRKSGGTKTPNFLTATFAGHSLFGGSAELISNGIRSNRTCTIQISNHLNVPLTDPRFYCYDGGLYYPLPPVIQPGTREACVFSKDSTTPQGVIGVLSYRVGSSSTRISVMFSVAYNQLQYRNHFGTSVLSPLDLSPATNETITSFGNKGDDEEGEVAHLFDQMYTNPDFYSLQGRTHSLANDGVPTLSCDGIYQIRGSMNDRGKAIIKLNVSLPY